MTKTGGAQFDPASEQLYFIATAPEQLAMVTGINRHFLCAVNEIEGGKGRELLKEIFAAGSLVFIDSGVFNLAMEHARKHQVSMDVALGLRPDEIDGFNDLYDRYVDICSTFGEQSWGYIEIDQGGRENKIKTRAKLEAIGLRPIPVYHPINDGWDYFDYLAKRYDRICFGNVVQAEISERMRLISTAFVRRQRYPHLWIHLLGVTPSELLYSCPSSSCDSSTWLSGVRWGFCDATACGKRIGGGFDERLTYRYRERGGEHEERINPSWVAAIKMAGFDSEFVGQNWSNYCRDLAGALA